MKSYKVTTILQKHGNTDVEQVDDIIVLSDKDDINEFIQMAYGCFYDVIDTKIEDIDPVLISKTYLVEQAKHLIRWDDGRN